MKIHDLSDSGISQWERALNEFEAKLSCSLGDGRSYQFTYPLGYLQYLNSLGNSRCCIAEKDGQIVAMIGGAVLPLRKPDGTEQRIVFCEEVKLLAALRRTAAIVPLLDQFQDWVLTQTDIVISIVSDETPIKPSEYTNRIGLVRAIDQIMVLRVTPTEDWMLAGDSRFLTTDTAGAECHRQLTAGQYAVLSPGAEARSVMPPVWLAHPGGEACGRLEDRRKVRQVTVNDGSEIRPVFLGSFEFAEARAGLELIEVALRQSAGLGFTALRMAVTMEDYQDLIAAAGGRLDIQASPGVLCATGVVTDAPWTLSGLEV